MAVIQGVIVGETVVTTILTTTFIIFEIDNANL